MDNNSDNKPVIFVVVRTKEGVMFNANTCIFYRYCNCTLTFIGRCRNENFISLINQHLVIHTMDGKENEIKVDNAVIKVYKNEVHIFLGLSGGQ